MTINKRLLAAALIIAGLTTGCDTKTSEYNVFLEKYGSDTRIYCSEDNYLMRETFLSPEASAPQTYLINSQECKN